MDGIDELASAPRGRTRTRLAITMPVVALVAAGAAWAYWPQRSATSVARSSTADTKRDVHNAPTADDGTVFLEPLPQCLRTDHRRTLRIALGVTNFADGSLQLVSVEPVGDLQGLTVTRLHVGAPPCAAKQRALGNRLVPAAELVVAMSFAVGPSCPPAGAVAARLGFQAGGRVLHAETSNLVNLDDVSFAGCPRAGSGTVSRR